MTSRHDELARRRQVLELRSERLRREMAEDAVIVRDTVTRADDLLTSARRYTSPALLVAGGVLVMLMLANPARSIAWITRGALVLSLARRAVSLARRIHVELRPPRE